MRKLLYLIGVLVLFICSCTTTKYVEVPIETVKKEYIYDTKIDSIFIKDSVEKIIKGDSIYIYKEKVRYKYINKTDTLVRVDSVPKVVPIEIIKEVEVNHLKWYQEVLMWVGGILSLMVFGYIMYRIKRK